MLAEMCYLYCSMRLRYAPLKRGATCCHLLTDGTALSRGVAATRSAESGGGLYNAGALDVSDAVFSDNVAGEGGLAIHDEGSFMVMENVTFDDNKFSCSDGQYTDVQEVSTLLFLMSSSHVHTPTLINPDDAARYVVFLLTNSLHVVSAFRAQYVFLFFIEPR